LSLPRDQEIIRRYKWLLSYIENLVNDLEKRNPVNREYTKVRRRAKVIQKEAGTILALIEAW